MAVVTIRQLLDSGVHFGHQTRRWNPKVKRFILTERSGIHIIDLQQSLAYIDKAYEYVKETVAHGGTVLFVGTKKQAQESIAEQATRVGQPYVNQRWLGGLLTNFQTVSKRLARMKELEELDFEDTSKSGFTKKELLIKKRELDKLHKSLGGIRNLTKTPSAIWVVDSKREHLAIDEARKLNIPVIGILDTNADPDELQFPIPGNDDAIRSVGLLTRIIADAAAEGLIQRHQKPEEGDEVEPLAAWEAELLAASETPQATDEKIEAVDGRVESTESNVEAVAEVVAAQTPTEENDADARRRRARGRRRRDARTRAPRRVRRRDRGRDRSRGHRGREEACRQEGCREAGRRQGGEGREARRREGREARRQGRSFEGGSCGQEAGSRQVVNSDRHERSIQPSEGTSLMADVTMADIKTLRERLGTGMVDTKNALVEADGDLEKATELLRLKGAKGNAKRADRSTSEGLIAAVETATAVTMIELASETDFVAKSDKFIALGDTVLQALADSGAETLEAALATTLGNGTVESIDRRRGRRARREDRAAPHRAHPRRQVLGLPAPHEQGPAAAGRCRRRLHG